MTITREEMIRKLSEKSGFYMQDVRHLLKCMDDVVFEELCSVTEDDDVVIQLMPGVKIMSTTVGERTRRHPITQEEIVCEPTCKVKTKISYDFMSKVQDTYNNKKDG